MTSCGAIPEYQRAIEIDPNFAMAYARLGTVYNNLQQSQLSEQNRQKAFELRDRASEREKLYITAHYYADSGQLDKGITAYELYRQTYPRDSIPYNNLAVIYNQLGQFDNGLENAKRAVELDPDQLNGYGQVAASYLGLNRLDEARAILNTSLQHKGSNSLHVFVAALDWCEGKEADMEKELQTASATPDGELQVLGFRANLAAERGELSQVARFRAPGRRGSESHAPGGRSRFQISDCQFRGIGRKSRPSDQRRQRCPTDISYGFCNGECGFVICPGRRRAKSVDLSRRNPAC